MSSNNRSELSDQIKFLQAILENAESTPDEVAADNLACLLKQLDEADGIAQGVEDKLDKILESLEGMIGELEEGNKHPNDQINGHSNSDQQAKKTKS